MSTTVALVSHLRPNPEGGYLWVYLNWALGLRALGCRVVWLEGINPTTAPNQVRATVATLKHRLRPYGLAESVALCSWTEAPLDRTVAEGCLEIEPAEVDLLLNVGYYEIPTEVVARFRRSALIDIDPGLLQIWMTYQKLSVARHDVYFTIGETVGRPGARFPDAGLTWQYTPPCVALEWWPPCQARADAPFTTISHWWGDWVDVLGTTYANDKRSGFLPFLDLPGRTDQPLELALCLGHDQTERLILEERGWRVGDAQTVAFTPWDYQRYIQESRGEFSCVKPSCIRLQNAWISDRTLCYLASGKPAVVQHTGSSLFLPDRAGLLRFRDLVEAAQCLDSVAVDYERQCRLARALVEQHFDARKVVARVLERALP